MSKTALKEELLGKLKNGYRNLIDLDIYWMKTLEKTDASHSKLD